MDNTRIIEMLHREPSPKGFIYSINMEKIFIVREIPIPETKPIRDTMNEQKRKAPTTALYITTACCALTLASTPIYADSQNMTPRELDSIYIQASYRPAHTIDETSYGPMEEEWIFPDTNGHIRRMEEEAALESMLSGPHWEMMVEDEQRSYTGDWGSRSIHNEEARVIRPDDWMRVWVRE